MNRGDGAREMKLRRIALWALLLSSGAGCTGTSPAAPEAHEAVPVEPMPADPRVEEPAARLLTPHEEAQRALFATASNAFAFDFWAKVRSTPGNLAVSPASIEMALAMTYGGAAGQTRHAMARTLHVEGEEASFRQAAGRQLAAWNDPDRESYELRVANRLFGERSYALVPEFLTLTRTTYAAPMELVDFRHHPDGVRTHINSYVSDFTNARITNLLPPASVTPDTRLVVTNAVYMKAQWRSPFEQNMTRPAPFHVDGATTTEPRPTMHQFAHFPCASVDGVKLLELPYQGDDLSMLIVLPDALDGLEAVESGLTAARLQTWLAALATARVGVALPKFSVDPPEPTRLHTPLAELGMAIAFDPAHADFTDMARPPSPDERLYISEVFHKAFVVVDEAGTEAAAATAVVMMRGTGMPEPALPFNVDHPFLFLIRDVHSGAILFLGRIVDPHAAEAE